MAHSYAALVRSKSDKPTTMRLDGCTANMSAAGDENGSAEAMAVDGLSNFTANNTTVKLVSGAQKDDEKSLEMVMFIKQNVLPGCPATKIKEFVEQLLSDDFGIYTPDLLHYLKNEELLSKVKLPFVQKKELKRYLDSIRLNDQPKRADC